MSFQPQFDTHRYTDELAVLHAQSLVECRLPGSEIGSILAVSAYAVNTECICADGEVRYSGKLKLCIVYEDGNHKACRAERGAEFFHKAEGGMVTPACFAKTAFHVDNVTHRREGSGLYISVVVGATTQVFGGKQMEYLVGGENIVLKKKTVSVCKTVCVSGETEGEDEFETDYVGDILLHDETPLVTACKAHAGQIDVEGEMRLSICVLRSDESICTYERLVPFALCIHSEEALGQVTASARVYMKDVALTATADEESGKCKMVFAYTLCADCFLSSKDDVEIAEDAFSTQCEAQLEIKNAGGRYLTKQTRCVERVAGTAITSPSVDGEYGLLSAVMPRAEAVCKKTQNGFEAEGVLTAEVLLKNTDGGYKSTSVSLPFVFPIAAEGEYAEADCMVCGLMLRRNPDGETYAEAIVKTSIRCYQSCTAEYVSGMQEGAPLVKSNAAITLFIPRAGEDLWTVAKRRHLAPDELQKCNPDLKFPVREGERILVYRQIL